MYGNSSKLGRGGGRGGGPPRNRSSFHLPPPHRPSNGGILSLGGSSSAPRQRNATSTKAASAAVEESFSLISGNDSQASAMIIRLAPDLVEEIRRVEAQGGTVRIKFDKIANNPSGNVIDVSGKEFRFTWSQELGGLCDIYEERHSGEDGNGLLVGSGCAWRKLNVQRILDESTTNHVKMRSEEAERKHKSRKAIVLDHENPSMKSQIKQLAAVEANPRRMAYKQKKEHSFKKRKPELPLAGAPSKSINKSGVASTTNAKIRRIGSPFPSPPEQSGALASPVGSENITKSHVGANDVTPIQLKTIENTSSEKEFPTQASSEVWETAVHKANSGAKPSDLQSMLTTLLMENPKGMSLKALEKAIGDAMPNSVKKIEPIIRKIATFQAPGRYFLKPEFESFKKPSSESGSSPEDHFQQTPEGHREQMPDVEPSFAEKVPVGQSEDLIPMNAKLVEEPDAVEKIDIQQSSPDILGERKVSDNSEGQAASSSDSGTDSDSESDSSGSGSDSGSRSRSRSPIGSGSGSSSDSESDASSNSKEGSDEDVDIMTSDDDKEPKLNLQASEPGFSSSPILWKNDDSRPVQNGIDEKEDGDVTDIVDIEGHGSDAVNLEKDLPDDRKRIKVAENSSLVPNREDENFENRRKSFSPDHDALLERQNFIGNLFDDKEDMVQDSLRPEQSDDSMRKYKGKSKRAPEPKHLDEKSERTKRLKVESLSQPSISAGRDSQVSKSPPSLPPNRHIEDTYRGLATQLMNRVGAEGNADFGSQKGYDQASGKSSSDVQQSGRRSYDNSIHVKAPETAERPNKNESSGHGRNFSEKSFYLHEGLAGQREKSSRDFHSDDVRKAKKTARHPKEGGSGGKHSVPRKHGELGGKFNEGEQVSRPDAASSPKDNNRAALDRYPVGNGRGRMLHRELSDLELGELREPLPEETPAEETPAKVQFDRKDSFKQSENKPSSSDTYISDLSKGRPVAKPILDSGKPSPNSNIGIKKTPEYHDEDLTRSQGRVMQSQSQHFSTVDNTENGSQFFNKLPDASNRYRQNESGVKVATGVDGAGESHKKATGNAEIKHDLRGGLTSQSKKESKTQASSVMADLIDGREDTMLSEINNIERKRRESSSDEDSSYSKYEKDNPELKGPINDFVQYKEYVQEFQDKFDSYLSLNKIIESQRNAFLKLGKELELTKGKDMERYDKIVVKLNESFRQRGKRHKRLKKIFIVLHEELKHLKQRIKDFAQFYRKD